MDELQRQQDEEESRKVQT
ncbi:unnamed protein product, partial [Rotaria sp. Silwood2]